MKTVEELKREAGELIGQISDQWPAMTADSMPGELAEITSRFSTNGEETAIEAWYKAELRFTNSIGVHGAYRRYLFLVEKLQNFWREMQRVLCLEKAYS